MPQFISKVQYKTCEKGEYYDEQPRTLEETIELINNFPWAREQYADVELTGPSITILDDKGNYLKVGIYFGGRFTLYYLDAEGRYYEYYPLKIDKIYIIVTDFFNEKVNLNEFEKIRFAIAMKGYFITRAFEYRINLWRVALFSNDLTLFGIPFFIAILLTLIISGEKPTLTGLTILTLFILLIGSFVAFFYSKFHGSRKQYLKISRGNPEFIFGNSPDEIKTYNKANIKEIKHYINKNHKSPNHIAIVQIVFDDHSILCFSDNLISHSSLMSKFSDKWKFQRTTVKSNLWKMLNFI